MTAKRCYRCLETLPLAAFGRAKVFRRRKKRGARVGSICRACLGDKLSGVTITQINAEIEVNEAKLEKARVKESPRNFSAAEQSRWKRAERETRDRVYKAQVRHWRRDAGWVNVPAPG